MPAGRCREVAGGRGREGEGCIPQSVSIEWTEGHPRREQAAPSLSGLKHASRPEAVLGGGMAGAALGALKWWRGGRGQLCAWQVVASLGAAFVPHPPNPTMACLLITRLRVVVSLSAVRCPLPLRHSTRNPGAPHAACPPTSAASSAVAPNRARTRTLRTPKTSPRPPKLRAARRAGPAASLTTLTTTSPRNLPREIHHARFPDTPELIPADGAQPRPRNRHLTRASKSPFPYSRRRPPRPSLRAPRSPTALRPTAKDP